MLSEQLLKRSGSTITQYSFLPGLAEAKVLAQFITNSGLSWFNPEDGYKSTINTPAVKEVMKEFCSNGGAIFFSTHVLEVAEKLCNKIAIIKQGKLVVSGNMEEITKNSSLEDVFLELSNHA